MKSLLLLLLLAGCPDDGANACIKAGACCPNNAGNGVACGKIREECAVDPIGTCVCGLDYKWTCFGTQDLEIFAHHDLRKVD